MRLSKIVTLLLAGFLTFGSLNSVAAAKGAKSREYVKSSISTKNTKKQATSKTTHKAVKAVKTSKKAAQKAVKKGKTIKKKLLKELHKNTARNHYQSGVASFYASKFNGRRTANGEVFSNSAMTAAHKTLPFGTLVEVTNTRNGRSVVVRVNDRGPYSHARVIDLSKAAATQLGMNGAGTAHVKLAVLNKGIKAKLSADDDLYALNMKK